MQTTLILIVAKQKFIHKKQNQEAMMSSRISNQAFDGLASLIKLLPTGTIFAYQFINPLLLGGDDGSSSSCDPITKALSIVLIVICGLTCFFNTFTDSYKASDGKTHYGIATFKGLWPNPDNVDLSSYKIRFGDFVHAFFALFVFDAVALLNDETVDCFYSSFQNKKKILLKVLPTVVGVVSSGVFFLFPTKRHYIGYPASSSASASAPSDKVATSNSLHP